jgi:3D-(3,5/4)-trihydroxycyclohexane-1,2-dione acylhydrolase (decyclizing)
MNHAAVTAQRQARAAIIAEAGGIDTAVRSGKLSRQIDVTLSEAIVLGLIRQDVRRFVGIFGHGSTEVGEVLRVYEDAGLVKSYSVRSEIEAVHAATALRWVTGEKAAVFTSIGPGAMHALAASLAPLSDGIGLWMLLGDETTEDEGPNMQQIARHGQNLFFGLFSAMGSTYMLHTPRAISSALRRGLNTVDHPFRPGPFYLLMPMNTQPVMITNFNLDSLPSEPPPRPGAAGDGGARGKSSVYDRALEAILSSERVVVKVGGGARSAGNELARFLDLADAVAVTSPLVSGVIPFTHPRNMTVGGSKGSISGNFAMEEADCLVAVGSRFVCQSDCSRTGYPKVKQVININGDVESAMHYRKTIPLVGDAAATLALLNGRLERAVKDRPKKRSDWFERCRAKRREWDEFRQQRYQTPRLFDPVWGREVLTQPAVIKAATDWARLRDVVTFFDAGDVQANGFQISEDDRLGRTFTETGASYMGFAVSALLATALATKPFYGLALSGDGSFVMNPQVLIDGIEHHAQGCIVVMDNRRMGAISGLQEAQYGNVYATADSVNVDYAAWARSISGVAAFSVGDTVEDLISALDRARQHDGLSLIHVPVYWGNDPLGGMGVFGRWNVGNWCEETQDFRHEIGL